MKSISFILVVALFVIVQATSVEDFFNGLFKVYYNDDFYSLDWLRSYISKVRSEFGLETDLRLVQGIKEAVDRASAATGLDPLLIIAMVSVESGFRNVMGMAGEYGMMQIKPETAEFVARVYALPKPKNGWRELLWNYELNIYYGAHYLKYLLEKFKDLRKAIEHYNAGSKKEIYADKIFKVYESFKERSSKD